jgi:signal transduction histidine kinase
MRAGKLETAAREVDLAVLLKQTLEANEGYAVEHGVRLHYSAAGASIRVRADPDRLAQVVTNLVSNAVKFSPRGASVRVRAESRNGQARVLVEDAGPGVPEDFREQLFRPFAQADGSVTRSRGGTGLGLSIAKTLVESAGGRIGVDSPQGRGATFWFELPLVEPVR